MSDKILRCTLVVFVSVCSFCAVFAGKVSFIGSGKIPVEIVPEKNTGLNELYVIYDAEGVSMSYDSGKSELSRWYRYSNLGGGYAEELSGVSQTGSVSTLNDVEGDMGYIIETGDSRHYFWVVDYSKHLLNLEGVAFASEQNCGEVNLLLQGNGEPVKYFTINGQQRTLNQEIKIDYLTLEWNDASKMFEQREVSETIESFKSAVSIMPAPYCDTSFEVTGDKFLKIWGMEESVESEIFRTISVDARTEAVQVQNDNEKSNQINSGESSDLGGSAPADITFYAYVTDAVVHHEWQMATDSEFEDITHRFNEQDLNYIFTEEGTLFLRYVGSNYDGTCEVYSDTYTVNIGESELKCPNAFSPGVTEGVNDEWKVGYRSIVEFDCTIFNRWGVEMCHFTDPESGWDGKYRGKLVKPGVYYYVIKALGADGKEYKLSGDINIIKFNETKGASQEETVE